jgi:hypothetical protein
MDGKRNGNQKSRRSKATAVGWEIESFENRECLVRINPSSDLNVYLPMAEIPLALEPETLDLASHNDPFFSRWGNPFLTRQSQRMWVLSGGASGRALQAVHLVSADK